MLYYPSGYYLFPRHHTITFSLFFCLRAKTGYAVLQHPSVALGFMFLPAAKQQHFVSFKNYHLLNP